MIPLIERIASGATVDGLRRGLGAARGNILKALLILASVAMDHAAIAERLHWFGGSLGLALYLVQFVLACSVLLLAAMIRAVAVRLAFAIALSLATLLVAGFQNVAGTGMSYFDFLTAINAKSALGDAIGMYGGALGLATMAASLMLIGIALPPAQLPKRIEPIAIGAPLLHVLALTLLLIMRGGFGANGLPSAWIGLGYAGVYGYEWANRRAGPREQVRFVRHRPPVSRDLVLIVDESVSGQYLDINSPAGIYSGLAGAFDGLQVFNFGLASAITNCSVGSNVMLRYGGTREDQRHIQRMPSIWSYARLAGLTTVYLYAQRGGAHENMVTAEERREIAESHYFDHLPRIERDQKVAERLRALLTNNRPDFILVNKLGAHFPVQSSYPARLTLYRPALPHGSRAIRIEADNRWRFNAVGSDQDWRLYRNSYRNMLTWSVGSFFDRLLRGGPLNPATIVYTSDHGQNLHERPEAPFPTHCNKRPVMEEGVVPLVVIESGRAARTDWPTWAARNRNGMSHYRVFPTLLELMGYDPVAVRKTYGEPLHSPVKDPLTFATEFRLQVGSKPRWHRIDVDRIAHPPEGDLASSPRPRDAGQQ